MAGNPDYPHHGVYEDAATIGFLTRYPTLLGHCLVAPKRHVEDWVHDLDETEYLALQQVVHRVALAVSAVVPTERMYSLSLRSQQGNAHLHWHIAPLPPGVPYDQQQHYALMAETASWTSMTTHRRPSPGPSAATYKLRGARRRCIESGRTPGTVITSGWLKQPASLSWERSL